MLMPVMASTFTAQLMLYLHPLNRGHDGVSLSDTEALFCNAGRGAALPSTSLLAAVSIQTAYNCFVDALLEPILTMTGMSQSPVTPLPFPDVFSNYATQGTYTQNLAARGIRTSVCNGCTLDAPQRWRIWQPATPLRRLRSRICRYAMTRSFGGTRASRLSISGWSFKIPTGQAWRRFGQDSGMSVSPPR